MSLTFFDTNILVYTEDSRVPQKQNRHASDRRALARRHGCTLVASVAGIFRNRYTKTPCSSRASATQGRDFRLRESRSLRSLRYYCCHRTASTHSDFILGRNDYSRGTFERCICALQRRFSTWIDTGRRESRKSIPNLSQLVLG